MSQSYKNETFESTNLPDVSFVNKTWDSLRKNIYGIISDNNDNTKKKQ